MSELLVVILDVNPLSCVGDDAKAGKANVVSMVSQMAAFLKAFMLLHHGNQLAIIGANQYER